ncbi:Mu transposase domain-containing protein [Proteiniclasticum ruminis]|uniref:Transposase for insertion sequence element IS21-like C-terminal domain-containing protein n=1 Tax=Proteiniclasticum ruminis TaxID=398199 RepID=A0A1I5A7Q7_9CLOT|nr:hypothetical protein SAMN04488695_102367 [Proteiniclasticum ruminis]
MLPLPQYPYEIAQWSKGKVQPNCHIAFQRKFYSVPFEYLGEEVEVQSTQTVIEILYHHQRIASHKRLWGKDTYSTIREHIPPDKIFFADWEYSKRQHNHLKRLISQAKFQYPNACIEDINYANDRKLDHEQILEIASCNYI